INLDGKENWKCPNYAAADKPALAYIDDRCSYATNEVAINWNAPLAYLAAALEAIYNK
ncbi:MAG: glycoside hydrolase family 9 protein, partial [Fibrobacter sp.]|nr:glycoside hydrolase family 9 protein [Fibrobacter sp.]